MARHGTLYYGTLHYGMSCRYDQVLDILRMSFVCDSLDAVLAVFESVASFGADFKIVRVQDTFHPASDPSPTGHRGLTVNVQLESAHVAECRIVLGSGAGIDVQRLPRRSVAVVAALPAIGNDDHGALLQILRSATGPVNVGDGAVLYGGFPETSFPAISNGQIASIDATSAELDREWLAGPVAACLTSHDCLLSSITLSGATGLEDARLGTILSETVLMQLGRSLRVLRVAGCGVSGAIPLGIWRLCKRLEVLDLANNRLGGPAFPHHGSLLAALPPLTVGQQGLIDSIKKILVPERLLDEIKGACFHSIHRHGHIAMSSNKNHRQLGTTFFQGGLQIQPTHAGHTDISNQATVPVGLVILQEVHG